MIRVFKHHISGLSIAFGLIEALLFLTVVGLLWEYRIDEVLKNTEGPLVFIYAGIFLFVIFISIFASLGLYNKDVITNRRVMFFRLAVGLSAVTITLFAIGYLYVTTAPLTQYPRPLDVALGFSVLVGVLLITRWTFALVSDGRFFREKVVILGAGSRAAKLRRMIAADAAPRYDIVRCIALDDEPSEVEHTARISRSSSDADGLMGLLFQGDVDEVVVCPDNRRGLPVDALLRCKMSGIRVSEPLAFMERELGRVNPDDLQASWLVFSDGFNFSAFGDATKRAFDLLLSVIFLLFTLPLTVTAAIVVKLDSPGPIFYRQGRTGLHGKPFMLFKFRSMRTDAEADGPRWAAQNDSRITRSGSFLRKTRIDEIPQILNVLRGEMSFVGPRPERPVFVTSLAEQIPYYHERHCAKPGITGWAQINYPYGASVEDAKEKLSYDLYYVKNRSLFLDIIIILQTVRVIFWPAGVR